MDAVTYPNPAVIEFMRHNVIPVRMRYDQQPLAVRFRVTWTPTLIALDAQGNEVYRNEGFLSPENLISALMLGIGKVKLQAGQYAEGASDFSRLVSGYPKSEEAPEAMYYWGVARFKSTKDLKVMQETYEKLLAAYPNSSWTKKAEPYLSVR
ncbi:MAG: tetratricopeptide repeat protein [Desulfomonile sp.]|nr:tetratricopeptide repeat protein [Deltaproteobacteria bacterium]